MDEPLDLRGIGYLALAVPDVGAWSRFATDVIGLMPARSLPGEDPMAPVSAGSGVAADGTVFLKADERQWRISLQPSEQPGLAAVGLELGSEAAFDAAVAELRSRGLSPVTGKAELATARGVRDVAQVVDPSGVTIELYWGPTLDGGFVSPAGVPRFVTGELGLGHYVLLVPDLASSMAFYRQALGFRLTDYVLLGPGMSIQFLRCTRRHHSVGLGALGGAGGVHHIALEVTDVDQVGYALERATRAGVRVTASLGRHKNDRMLSFYMRSPAGFDVEIGCGGLLVDDRTWVVNHFTGGDEWGHHGLTAEAMTAAPGDT